MRGQLWLSSGTTISLTRSTAKARRGTRHTGADIARAEDGLRQQIRLNMELSSPRLG
jgi:hypothetical protein